AREKHPRRKARLAQPLMLSLALVTLMIAGVAVAVPTLATGSARPSDWGRVNWGLVSGRFSICANGKHGLGVLGCLTAIGPRANLSTASQKRGVVYVTAPVQDSAAPPAAPPSQSSATTTGSTPAQRP